MLMVKNVWTCQEQIKIPGVWLWEVKKTAENIKKMAMVEKIFLSSSEQKRVKPKDKYGETSLNKDMPLKNDKMEED